MKNIPGISQKGVAHLLLLVLLIAGIGLGLYLVQNKTNLLPFASNELSTPETSFQLESNKTSVKTGEEFKVNVMVRSDFDAANTFSAQISYPADKLEIVGIEATPSSVQNNQQSLNSRNSEGKTVSIISKALDSLATKVEAQTQPPMPTISAKSYCLDGYLLTVELNWAKVTTTDINYTINRSPDPLTGIFISALFDRYQYPIKDTRNLKYNTTYTYFIENGLGGKSNTVTVTTPAVCATPTPTAIPSPSATPVCSMNSVSRSNNVTSNRQITYSLTYPTDSKITKVSMPATPGYAFNVNGQTSVSGAALNADLGAGAEALSITVTADVDKACAPFTINYNLTNSCGVTSTSFMGVGSAAAWGTVCSSPAPSVTPPVNYTYFIKKWIDQSDDKKGTLTLSGAVPNPGFKTEVGKKALMATVTFRAKADGEAKIDFKKEGTGIYRNSDNQNILTITKGTGVIIGSGGVSSGTPTPAYPGTLYLKPATSYVNRGCTLPVVVAFSTGGRNSDGVDALLQFNPKIMTVSSYSKGDSFADHKISVNNDTGKLSISGLSSAEKAFNGAGILATVNFVINSSVAPGTKAGVNFDFDPGNLDKTTDSNIVETKVIRDILGSVTNGTYTIGEGSLCSSPTPAPSTKPTLEGSDGTWCTDSDGNGNIKNTGTCIDSSGLNKTDYCEGNTARDGYCSGSWDGKTWTKVHCEFGGYVCNTGTSCKEGTCIGASPSPSATPGQSVNAKRADLFKDSNKPDYVNDQDVSVFFSKCAEKGVELFGQPATVQPICDILEDGKITVSDWAVLVKFRNQSVAQ